MGVGLAQYHEKVQEDNVDQDRTIYNAGGVCTWPSE